MTMSLVKTKFKTKKQKDFLTKLREISDAVKEEILVRYMDKCKHENAVKFFEWRKRLNIAQMDKDH